MKIGLIGMGKLGYCLAAVLGTKYEVVGVDKIEPLIPEEPMLREYLEKSNLKIGNYKDLRGCEVIFCVVPTPSKKDGKFSDKHIKEAIKLAKPYMGKCKLFNVVSTVMPGTCEKLKKLLPKTTAITYNPEFIALGNIIKGMINPDFVLIGGDNSGDLLEEIYIELLGQVIIKRMDLKSAELAKISLNSYITMKITFANILGQIGDKIGADANKVCDAIGMDHRIGTSYLCPGSPYGGPCFPRDNRAFGQVCPDVKTFAEKTDFLNKQQICRWVDELKKDVDKEISIIGTSYKLGTKNTEESAALIIGELLKRWGAKVTYEDFNNKTKIMVFCLPGYDGVKNYAKKNKIKVIDLWK